MPHPSLGKRLGAESAALFFNQEPAQVILLVGEAATHLRQLPAASGARYGSATQIVSIKGDRATWVIGAAPAMHCELRASMNDR